MLYNSFNICFTIKYQHFKDYPQKKYRENIKNRKKKNFRKKTSKKRYFIVGRMCIAQIIIFKLTILPLKNPGDAKDSSLFFTLT